MSFLRPCGSKRQSRADRLALEALFEQVSVAPVLSIIIVHVRACYTFNSLTHSFIALANQEVSTFGAVSTNRASSKLVES